MMNRSIVLSLELSRTRVAEASLDDVFTELTRTLETCDDENGGPVTVLTSRPPYVLHVNGYLRTIRSCVNRVMKRYKEDLTYHVQPDPFSKMLVSIVLTPRPNKGQKAKFVGGTAKFVAAPYRGRPVTWSRRLKTDVKQLQKKFSDAVFSVRPDVWNNTFYGWIAD